MTNEELQSLAGNRPVIAETLETVSKECAEATAHSESLQAKVSELEEKLAAIDEFSPQSKPDPESESEPVEPEPEPEPSAEPVDENPSPPPVL